MFILKIIKRIKQYFYNRRITKQIRYWREHPTEFCEEYLGCKLYPYQKVLLNKMVKEKKCLQ